MVLAQKQIWIPVEESTGPRYESTQLCPPYFLTKAPKTDDGVKTASSTNVAGKSGYLPAKKWNYIHVYHPVVVST
jgi:hypothetical protein